MKDLGASTKILGIDIKRDMKKYRLCLTKEMYLRKILERFGMSNYKLVTTVTTQQFKLSATQSPITKVERTYIDSVPYACIVGSLMYVLVCTRPAITCVVSLVSGYMANPGKAH